MKKKILIISCSDLKSDPRVNRQIRFLSERYRLTTVGYNSPQMDGVEFFLIRRKLRSFPSKILRGFQYKFGQYDRVYWDSYYFDEVAQALKGRSFDLIIANDLETLPFALKIAGGAKVIFDAHEYYPKEAEEKFFWRFFHQEYQFAMCRKYLPQADAMWTVSDGIADEFHREFHLKARPTVVTNAPDYVNIPPSRVDKGKIDLIYHGSAMPCRRIDLLIKMMDHTDERYNLNLMLINNYPKNIRYLHDLAKGKKNVRFLEPVTMREITKFTNQFDLGVYIFKPDSFNNYYALPNKFFEYIQARLAIAIAPSVEMAKIVNRYRLGVVAEDFRPASLAARLNALSSEDIQAFKANVHRAAEELSSRRNRETIESQVKKLVG